jgi:DNA-nicking Smr family endonuclease
MRCQLVADVTTHVDYNQVASRRSHRLQSANRRDQARASEPCDRVGDGIIRGLHVHEPTSRAARRRRNQTDGHAADTSPIKRHGHAADELYGLTCAGHDSPVKLKLDLHEIYNRGDEIERALQSIIDEAVAKKAPLVEIIPGKGTGQLKKRVLRFLDRKDIKAIYHRVEKDSDNFGRVFVHFRWK